MKEGWEVKKLGEVAFYPNKRISLSDLTPLEYVGVECMVKDKGGVAFSDKLPNTDTAIEFIENDILIGNIRPYLKKIWLSDRHGGASGDVVNIRISEEYKGSLSAAYLHKVLSTDAFFEYDNSNTHGAKMPRGDRKAIAKYKVSLPPKSTQLAIVAELDQINDLIRLKKEQLKEYDNLAQSIFYDMFGDPVENEKGWEVKKLGEVCDVSAGQSAPQGEQNYCDDGIPFIKAGNLEALINGLPEISVQKVSQEVAQKHKLKLYKTGSIVFAKSGMSCMKGYVHTLNTDCFVVSHLAILFSQTQSNCFIKYFLQYLKPYSLVKDAAYPSISLYDIAKIPISLPPLPLQEEFSSRIEQIEKQKTEVQKTITDLETLLAARMQHWFE